MPSLLDQSTAAGITTIRANDARMIPPSFIGLRFGARLVRLAAAGGTLRHGGQSATVLIPIASTLQVLGTVGVAIGTNVPMADRPATLRPATAESIDSGDTDRCQSTALNTTRTGAAAHSIVCRLAGTVRHI